MASGTLDGTPSSFGDYDQCLAITAAEDSFRGMYCLARFRIKPRQELAVLQALQERFPVFDYVHLNQALCLPSSCSPSEAERLLNHTLLQYPLQLTEEFTCDTLPSLSWESKVANANSAQIAAVVLLTLLLLLCIAGTVWHVLTADTLSVLSDFSLKNNLSFLLAFNKRASGSRLETLDYIKFLVVVVGVGGHCLSCLETIPSWYTFARLYEIKHKFKSIWVQPLLNEAGLGLITFVGGFVTFWSAYTPLASGSFRMGAALFEKWIRFMPSIMVMVAIDLLWPMYGSGPMFTGIAKHLLNKCTRNSWMNLLFVSNFVTAPENVSRHLRP